MSNNADIRIDAHRQIYPHGQWPSLVSTRSSFPLVGFGHLRGTKWLRACCGWSEPGVVKGQAKFFHSLHSPFSLSTHHLAAITMPQHFSAATIFHNHFPQIILLLSSCAPAWPWCATLGSPPPCSLLRSIDYWSILDYFHRKSMGNH